ncbi:MAG: alcohol dehydrogenase catalytic domain-containing protein [Clostridiales bacterium]|nr:alcohol dehydrogenase catalytic domain-containing protein [Clostridiales bacterium]
MKGYKVTNTAQLELIEMSSVVLSGQVKIKVNRIGLSRDDIFSYSNPQQDKFILGRQCVGLVVETADDVTNFERGNRVIINPFLSCQQCSECRQGNGNLCNDLQIAGKNTDGYLRDFVISNSRNLYLLPENVSDSEAVFVEHTARALAIIHKMDMQKGDHIVIIGASIVGLILAQLVIYYQGVPIIIDARESHLEMASKLGICYTINHIKSEPYKKIISITGGRMSENLALMGSSGISLFNSLNYVKRGGNVVIADAYNYKDNDSGAVPVIAEKQISLHSVSYGIKQFMPAINLLANKTVVVSQFVSQEIEFEQVPEFFAKIMENPLEYVKVIVKNK